jgi:hypothetical protein
MPSGPSSRPPQPAQHTVAPPLPPSAAPARTAPVALTNEQKGWLEGAWRRDINGWLHVSVNGAPFERGFQYGYLVADEYAESIRVYREMTYQDIGMTYDFFVEKAVELHADKLPAEVRTEMEGVAAGLTAAGVPSTFDDVIGINDWMNLPAIGGRRTRAAIPRWPRREVRATIAAPLSAPAAPPPTGL